MGYFFPTPLTCGTSLAVGTGAKRWNTCWRLLPCEFKENLGSTQE